MRGTKNGWADLKRLQKEIRLQAKDLAPVLVEPVRTSMQDDATAFERAMSGTQAIKRSNRVPMTHSLPSVSPAVARRRAAALGETSQRADQGVSDGGDIAPLLSENGTAFVRHDVAPDTARNLKRGQWPAGAELDLHGLRIEQARHAVLSFLDECYELGIRCIRVIHGKGYGSQGLEPVLRDKVRTWLVQKPEVMAFSQAPERAGGEGALLILLRQDARGSR